MARKPAPNSIGLDEIRAIVDNEMRQSLGWIGGQLSFERQTNFDYYLGRPFGNEQAGRSQVVSHDVEETVEWIMPSLMRIFTAGPTAVRFDVGDVDSVEPNYLRHVEAQAEQKTNYANHIFYTDNPGFLILYSWIKDALIQKNGIVKCWWNTITHDKRETYRGLTDDAYALLMQDVETDDLEVIEDEEVEDQAVDPATGQPTTIKRHNVVVKRSREKGRAKIEGVAPEEFFISREARAQNGIQDARYVGHRVLRVVSDLVEWGVPQDIIEQIPTASVFDLSQERQTRDTVGEHSELGPVDSYIDESMRPIWITEHYLRADYDGDGVAELIKVFTGGSPETSIVILENEDGPMIEPIDVRPFASITPIILPHRFYGRAVADAILDLQLIKSTIWRQMLDNLYLQNNPITEVVDGQVNLDDLLNRKPGSIVRVKTPGMMREVPTEFAAAQSFPMLEYIDQVRENRTGASRLNQGLEPDQINDTATGIQKLLTASQGRIELIARVLAETGVKDLFKLIDHLVCTYQDEARVIQINGKWVTIDPRSWTADTNITVNVGLGTGDQDMLMQRLLQMLSVDAQVIQMQGGPDGPFIGPQNLYAKLKKLAEYMGFKSPDEFYTDPSTAPPKPPKPDPKMMEVQGKLQAEQAKQQGDMQIQQQKMAADAQAQVADGQIKLTIEREKMAQEAQLKREQMAAEFALKREQMAAEFALKREQMALDAQVQTHIAEKQAEVSSDVRFGGETG